MLADPLSSHTKAQFRHSQSGLDTIPDFDALAIGTLPLFSVSNRLGYGIRKTGARSEPDQVTGVFRLAASSILRLIRLRLASIFAKIR